MPLSPTNNKFHKRQTSTSTERSGPKSKLHHVSGLDEITRRTLATSRKMVTLVDYSISDDLRPITTIARNILIGFSMVAKEKLSPSPALTTLSVFLSIDSDEMYPLRREATLALDKKALEFIKAWMTDCCDHTKKFTPAPYPDPKEDFIGILRILLYSSQLGISALENNIAPLVQKHINTACLSTDEVMFIWRNYTQDAPIVIHLLHYLLRPLKNISPTTAADKNDANPDYNPASGCSRTPIVNYEALEYMTPCLYDAIDDLSERIAKRQERAKRAEENARKAAERKKNHEAYLVREKRRQERAKKEEEWARKQTMREPGNEYVLKPGQRTRAGLLG